MMAGGYYNHLQSMKREPPVTKRFFHFLFINCALAVHVPVVLAASSARVLQPRPPLWSHHCI